MVYNKVAVFKPAINQTFSERIGIAPTQEINLNDTVQVGGNNSSVGAWATVYTIPEGFTLYVNTAYLQMWAPAVGSGNDAKLNFGTFEICRIWSNGAIQNLINPFSFAIPFKLYSGQTISCRAAAAANPCSAGFTGFLVRNKPL